MFHIRLFKKTKCILWTFRVKTFMGLYKSKVVYHKKLVFQSGVGFLIRCILDHAHCPLVAKNDNFDGNKSIFLL